MDHPYVQHGIVTAIHIDKEGAFADIILMPENVERTARIAVPFGGEKCGLWLPIAIDDTVPVFFSDANEPFILGNTWSRAEEPPQRAIDKPEAVVLVQKKDGHIYIETSGAGNFVLTVDKGKLHLGDENATEAAMLGTTYRQKESQCNAGILAAITPVQAVPVAADLASAIALVNACAKALAQGIFNSVQAFEQSSNDYLSHSVVVKKQ